MRESHVGTMRVASDRSVATANSACRTCRLAGTTPGGGVAVSPRRRLLVGLLVAVLLVVAGVVGVRLLRTAGPTVDPVARPAQDRPGPVLLVPGLRRRPRRVAAARGADRGHGPLGHRPDPRRGRHGRPVRAGRRARHRGGRRARRRRAVGRRGRLLGGRGRRGAVGGARRRRGEGTPRRHPRRPAGRARTLAATAAVVAPDACPAACRQLAPGSAEITELARGTAWARRCRGCRSGPPTTRPSPRPAPRPRWPGRPRCRSRRCARGRGCRTRRSRPIRPSPGWCCARCRPTRSRAARGRAPDCAAAARAG